MLLSCLKHRFFARRSCARILWRDKLKETLIEIFSIVFAVSLPIWLHDWSEQHGHKRKVAGKFLRGLRSDLRGDIIQIERNKSIATNLLRMYDTLFRLPIQPIYYDHHDSLHYNFIVDLITTRPNLGRYEGVKSSGKLETIEDDSLRQKILAYFQQSVPDLSNTENFINSMQLKILDQQMDRPDKMSRRH